MSDSSLVVSAELQPRPISIGEELADSLGFDLAGLCTEGVDAAGDLGCKALDAPGEAGLCGERDAQLEGAGDLPPAPSWPCM